ncbi:membrane associated rhomboid family serine protease [Crossiella equi]|uniref:Membrane associated rhomboid family serine protease n=1 Tax=Crossiella equi TaxID=130796 RepID=A0ABS5AGN1_9PSEU|nr:rhomboid family intramembrane serine protease [Crossiella equi]MBP2475512.1 membrane associated rhomboid family serine protease [Crossiella equi]
MTESYTLPACTRHADRQTGLSCTRCGKPYCYECLRDASVGKQCVDCVAEGQKGQRRAVNMVGNEDRGGKPVVVLTLIVLNVAIFVLTAIQGGGVNSLDESWVFDNGGMSSLAMAGGQWWRLITSGFLHFALWHLALNMFSLWMLGQDLEPLFGRLRFTLLYFLSLLGGGVAVYLFSGPSFTAGASGAVFGLFGAVAVIYVRRRLSLQPLLIVLAINVGYGLFIGNVSWEGHAGGLVVGALVAAGLIYVPSGARVRWQAINLVAITAALVGLTFFQYSSQPKLVCTPPGQITLCGNGAPDR